MNVQKRVQEYRGFKIKYSSQLGEWAIYNQNDTQVGFTYASVVDARNYIDGLLK